MSPDFVASQIRAARGLLDWSQTDLAQQAKVGICTVRRIEREGPEHMRENVTKSIMAALTQGGILFIPRGVKLRAQPVPAAASPGEKL